MSFAEDSRNSLGSNASERSKGRSSLVVREIAPWLEENQNLLPHQEAAMLVEYAREGQELTSMNLTSRARLCYRLRVKNHLYYRITAWSLMLIFIFTRPSWTFGHDDWKDGSVFPSWKMPYMPLWLSSFLDVIGLCILWSAVGTELGYKLQTRNWYLTILFLMVMCVETLQVFLAIIYAIADVDMHYSLSVVRPLLCLLVERKYESYVGYILYVIPRLLLLLGAVTVMVGAYTSLGFQLFSPESPEAVQYFSNFGDALWNMFMVLTSSNWPSPMIPAINENRAYFFYFLFYILVVEWGMMNLVLGFVYMFFRIEQEDISTRYLRNKALYLSTAFKLLDVENRGYLSAERINALLDELYEFYMRARLIPTSEEKHELFLLLDSKRDGRIDVEEFQLIIESCHKHALKDLRAQKVRFFRYLNVRREAESRDNGTVSVDSGAYGNQPKRSISLAALLSWHGDSQQPRQPRQPQDEDSRGESMGRPSDLESTLENSDAMQSKPTDSRAVSVSAESMHRTVSEAGVYGRINNPLLMSHYLSQQSHANLGAASDSTSAMNLLAPVLPLLTKAAIFIDTKTFDGIMDCFLFVLALCIFADITSLGLVIFYSVVSLVECICKLSVKGLHRYKRSVKSTCDGAVTAVLVGTLLISGNTSHLLAPNVAILWVILFRTLLFPRNILAWSAFTEFRHRHRYAFQSAFKGLSHLLFLLLFLIVMLMFFSALGTALFGGLLRKEGGDSTAIRDSSYGSLGYWPLNFNDLPSGFFTMFLLLHVNNMHVTTAGMEAAAGGNQWVEVFFTAWYCLGVLLVLNIAVAVLLNHFVDYLQALQEEEELRAEQQGSESGSGKTGDLAGNLVLSSTADKVRDQDEGGMPDSETTVSAVVAGYGEETVDLPNAIDPSGVTRMSLRTISQSSEFSTYSTSPFVAPSAMRASALQRYMQRNSSNATRRSEGASARQSEVDRPISESNIAFGSSLFASAAHRKELLQRLQAQQAGSGGTLAASRPGSSVLASSAPGRESGMRQSYGTGEAHPTRVAKNSDSVAPPTSERWLSFMNKDARNEKHLASLKKSQASTLTETFLDGPSQSAQSANLEAGDAGEVGRASFFTARFVPTASDHPDATNNPDSKPTQYHSDDEGEHFKVHRQMLIGVEDDPDEPIYVDLALQVTSHTNHPGLSTPSSASSSSPYYQSQPLLSGQAPTTAAGGTASEREGVDAHIAHSALLRHAHSIDGSTPASALMAGLRSRMSFSEPKGKPPLPPQTSELTKALAQAESNAPSAVLTSDNPQGKRRMSRMESMSMHETHILEQLRAHNLPAIPLSKSLHHLIYDDSEISNFEKAAILVQFAREGREHHIFTSRRSMICYKLRNTFAPALKILAFALAMLKFFDRPYWSYDKDEWNNDHIYPNSGVHPFSPELSASLKLILLTGLLAGLSLEVGYQESGLSATIVLRGLLIVHSLVTWGILVYYLASGFHDPMLMAFVTDWAVLYVLWFNQKSLNKFKLVLNILPRFSVFLFIFLLVVLIFAGFGPPIYQLQDIAEDDDANNVYFSTFSESVWSVFVAITSSSFPNQVMPSYREYRDVCIYVVSFITLGAFALLNIIIVVVLVEFQRSAQLANDKQKTVRQLLLMRAFEVLDENCVGYVEKDKIRLLLDELYMHYADFKKAGIPKGFARDLLVDILDVDGDGRISMNDFLFLLDVVRIKLSLDTKVTFIESHFPSFAVSQAYSRLKSVVLARTFDVVIDCFAALLLIISLSINVGDVYYPSTSSIAFTIIIAILFSIEMVAKIMVLGFNKYVRSFRNTIDCTITCILVLCMIAASAHSSLYRITPATFVIKIVLMIRLILLPRNARFVVKHSHQMTKLARLIRRVIAKITTLSIVFLCTGYVFALVGMLLFGGQIQKIGGDPDLYTSTYAEDGYWPLNFNDFFSACMTLFSCLKVSDFDVITSGFTSTTTNWARLYFTAWYVVGVLLFLNIIKSFFLGEFLMLFGRAGIGTPIRTKGSARRNSTTATAVTQDTGAGDASASTPWASSEPPGSSSSGRTLSHASSKQAVARHLKSQIVDRLRGGFVIDNSDVHNPVVMLAADDAATSADNPSATGAGRGIAEGNTSWPVPSSESVEENYFPVPSPSFASASQDEKRMHAAMSWTQRDTFVVDVHTPPADVEGNSEEAGAEYSPGGDRESGEEAVKGEDGLELEDVHVDPSKRRSSTTRRASRRSSYGLEGMRVHASTTALKHADQEEQAALKKRLRQLAQQGFATHDL